MRSPFSLGRTVVVVTAIALSGCPEPLAKRCGPDLPPCAGGEVCISGVCAIPEDTGASGGGAAGGSAAGGSAAGGGAAGGSALPTCDGGCAPWAFCASTAGAASCVDGRLEVSLPLDGGTVGAGEAVGVAARLLLPDGGAWPGPALIPVVASWGASTTVSSGVPGSLPGASDAGVGEVRIGWTDGGPNEARPVAFAACWASVAQACEPWQGCAPGVSGGACVSQGFVVAWLSPDAGAASNQSSVSAQVRVTRVDGGLVGLSAIPVSGVADFTGAGGLYAGALPLSGADGPRTFVAGWPDGGPSQALTLVRDTVAPAVSLVIEPRTGADPDPQAPSAWKKDERALVKVTVDGGRAAVASDLIPPTGGVVSDAPACTNCTGSCRCFELDVAGTTVNGLRATLGLQVAPIEDEAGNASAVVDGGLEVTRLAWTRSLPADITTRSFPLAVSHRGDLVVALSGRGSIVFPLVMAFTPSGSQRALTVPSPTSAPVLESNGLGWIGTAGGVAEITPFSLTAAAVPAATCLGPGATLLALMRRDSGVTAPVGLSQTGELALGEGPCPMTSLAGNPASVAIGPRQEVLAATSLTSSTVHRRELDDGGWRDSGDVTFAALPARSLFIDALSRVVGSLGAYMGGDGVAAFEASGPPLGAMTPVATGAGISTPLSSDGTFLFGGLVDGGVGKIPYGGGRPLDGGIGAPSHAGLLTVTPVLGEGGYLYALGTDRVEDAGILTVSARLGVLRQADLSLAWSAEFPFVENQQERLIEPALDVYRTDAGTKDCAKPLGLLYVLSGVGSEVRLRAVLVDSRGLDPTAAWPKFQRDNANSANITLPTAPWSCP